MIDYEYYNEKILELLSYYLNYMERSITEEQVKSITSLGVGKEYAVRKLLIAAFGITDQTLIDEYFSDLVRLLHAKDYMENPYYKKIDFPRKTIGKWRIDRERYEPYELFVRDDFIYDGDKVIPALGFFDCRFEYPAVYENDRLWMSITPNEINTMRAPIAAAGGNVLTFGLGLGYFAYMCSLKESVESVTVVERDGSVLELFNRFILPRFECKDKIRIVECDAYRYLDRLNDGAFDYAFVDIYHDAGDGRDVYLKFRKILKEKNIEQTNFDFWIEKTIKYYL